MSPFKTDGIVWLNGRMVPWPEANIHIASHVIHYGSSIFEGFRAYRNSRGTAVFRLDAHIRRLYNSCKIYRMEIPFAPIDFAAAVLDTIRANRLESCYVRPIVYRGYGALGVDPFPNPVDCAILVWEWGHYLGDAALEAGVDVKVSTWTRMAANTLPALAKAGANYMNSQLIKMEAKLEGYAEGIALNTRGQVSEGSGENIFLVQDGRLVTPPLSSAILPGITRDCVLTLARGMGLIVAEDTIPREMLYVADEVFMTGSAAEVTPVRSVDRIPIGNGKRGPLTERIQKAFFDVVEGRRDDEHHWLTYVNRI